jgi:sensor c-di-GMP phosphodiesterase-like protein
MTDLIFNILVVVMLLTVGGVVLWLHRRLDILHDSAVKLPMLSERMAVTLQQSRQEMQKLQDAIKTAQPKLDKSLSDAFKMIQELEYLTDRASKVADRLDKTLGKIEAWEEKQTIETLTQKSGKTIAAPRRETGEEGSKTPPASKKTSLPPSRAELLLRQSLEGPNS